jgi:CRP-like cAMP-binding protein
LITLRESYEARIDIAAVILLSSVAGFLHAQQASASRLHEVERRLARWLLMATDRIDSGLLGITHDFLATMLGTDRSSVSVAAGVLQEMKIIKYRRGVVKVLDRDRLEICECYRAIQDFNGDRGWSLL